MVSTIKTSVQFDEVIKDGAVQVIHFAADFAEQCQVVTNFLQDLSTKFNTNVVKFYTLEAEQLSDVSLKYQIEAVPTLLYFKNGKLVERVNGSDPKLILDKVNQHTGENVTSEKPLNDRLKELINRHNVMVFMKGNKAQPRCGFSKQLMEILNNTGVAFDTFDILQDEEVRQGLKVYSEWPTYPQLYVKGELIGGLDIIKELQSSNELLPTLNA